MMARRILVTGGLGFLGSALVRRLRADGNRVTVLDLPRDGAAEQPDVGLDLTTHDAALTLTTFLVRDLRPDLVVHAAAINGTRNFYERPGEVFLAAALGTINVALAFRNYGRGRLIHLSSSEVYHQSATLPTPESVPLVVPDLTNNRFSYSSGKITGEAAVAYLCQGLDTVIVRPHNVYGPGMADHHVVLALIDKLRTADPEKPRIEVEGDLRAVRTFCYVEDFVDAIMVIAETERRGDPPPLAILNVGSTETVSIMTLCSLIAGLLRLPDTATYDFSMTWRPCPPGSPMTRIPDLAEIMALGWRQKTPLRDGLLRTIEWRRENPGA